MILNVSSIFHNPASNWIFYAVLIGLILNFIGIVILGQSRVRCLKNRSTPGQILRKNAQPFVSIHLAICNEPPNVVIETLQSITHLNYRNYEVIIISNNTTNESSWKPIQQFALERGSHFVFHHFDRINGYKAGALNVALNYMNEASAFIFTVDADYQLKSNALLLAVGTITNAELDFVQFPQAYRNVCHQTKGLQLNYKHYFDCYLSSDKSNVQALPTGTLSIMRKAIFKGGFLWPTSTITEDAHLGVELLSRNLKIGYCEEIIGVGTMPTTLQDYTKQFKRWVFGNFQTLMILHNKEKKRLSGKWHLTTLLTAWINLLAIPILVALITFPFVVLEHENYEFLVATLAFSFFTHIIFQFILFFRISKGNIPDSLKALLIHIGIIEIGSFYWLYYFKNREVPFQRTNKFLVTDKISFSYFILPIISFIMGFVLVALNMELIGLFITLISICFIICKIYLLKELFYSKFNVAIQQNI